VINITQFSDFTHFKNLYRPFLEKPTAGQNNYTVNTKIVTLLSTTNQLHFMINFSKFSLRSLALVLCIITAKLSVLAGGGSSEKVIVDNNKVKIYAVLVNFDDTQNGFNSDYYELRFVNKTASDLEISWDLELHYDQACLNCDENVRLPEYSRNIKLKANETFESNCKEPEDAQYVIFKQFNNIQSEILTEFSLENLTVSEQ